MSRFSDEVILHAMPVEVLSACRKAVTSLGWRVLEQTQTRILCKEVCPQVTSFTWPAQVEIVIQSIPSGTKVTMSGAIFGFGPIQGSHLRGQVGNLRNRIESALAEILSSERNDTRASLGAELAQLADLRDRGALSELEFQQAKARLLNV